MMQRGSESLFQVRQCDSKLTLNEIRKFISYDQVYNFDYKDQYCMYV